MQKNNQESIETSSIDITSEKTSGKLEKENKKLEKEKLGLLSKKLSISTVLLLLGLQGIASYKSEKINISIELRPNNLVEIIDKIRGQNREVD